MGGDWRRGALAVALALLVAVSATACSDRRSATPDPTLPRRTTTTDPFAVPDPIDVAYVERVMEALDHLYGDAAREVAREQELTPRFEELMRAIYADEETLDQALELWERERDRGFANLAEAPGDPDTAVATLLFSRDDCIIAEVTRDFSPVSPSATPKPSQYIVLGRHGTAARANETGWGLTLDGFLADSGVPTEAECAA